MLKVTEFVKILKNLKKVMDPLEKEKEVQNAHMQERLAQL